MNRADVRLLFPWLYSPDCTPIESLWSKVKTYLRSVSTRSEYTAYYALGEAPKSVAPQDRIG